MEFEIEGISYRLHGKGFMAFNEKMYIDWDFGYRSRWCGIDSWKVSMTLKFNKSRYIEYYDGNLVHKLCERYCKLKRKVSYMFPIEGKTKPIRGVIGGDLVVIGDINHGGPDAVGFTISDGIGRGDGPEFHVQMGQTTTFYSINLFDMWDNIYDKNKHK